MQLRNLTHAFVLSVLAGIIRERRDDAGGDEDIDETSVPLGTFSVVQLECSWYSFIFIPT
jgi:hypothetical protein